MLPLALLPLGLAAPSRLDQANRCSSLPARPATARIVHSGLPLGPHALPASWKGAVAQLRVGEFTVAAPVGLALRPSCRQLVRELGQVSEVELAARAGRHLWRWLLAASYAGVAVRAGASAAAAPDAAEPGREPAYCDVLFTHGHARLGARLLPPNPLTLAPNPNPNPSSNPNWNANPSPALTRRPAPLLGLPCLATACAGRGGARRRRSSCGGCVHSSPRPSGAAAARLLSRLPWRAQRLAARAWVQAELPDGRG